jgi:hypothetical protein
MMHGTFDRRAIEIRGFKWPRRATSVVVARLIGEDTFGRWIGIASGTPWCLADRSQSGIFEQSFIKLVPSGTFWTACFQGTDPVVDVDIVAPVLWLDDVLEEVDLELDILRSADGTVHVRDQDEFDRVRTAWRMPSDIAAQAEATCERVRTLVERSTEPFGEVGRAWLARFQAETAATRS